MSSIPPRPEPNVTIISEKITAKERAVVIILWIVIIAIIGTLVFFVAQGRIEIDKREARAKAECLEKGYQEYWLNGNTLYCSDKAERLIITDFE